MGTVAGTMTPAEIFQLRCPRCWFTGPFIPGIPEPLTWRCGRCEWPFAVTASTPPAPAVPATGVATAAQASGSPMAVTISGGTSVTTVNVNGTSAGSGDGTYYVPVGGTISVAYSAAPTWSWALLQTSGSLSAGGTSIALTHGGGAFAYGQVLVIDPAGTADLVMINGTPSDTALPCTALSSSHATGKNITVAQLAPALSGTGQDGIPQTSY